MKNKKLNQSEIMYHTFLITMMEDPMKDEIINQRYRVLKKALTKKERKENKRLISDKESDDFWDVNV